MRVQPKAAAMRASSERKTHEARMKKWMLAWLLAALLLPTAFAQRLYDGTGRQIGRVDAERFYNASGQQMGSIDGDLLYDGSGRQIGRADGLRRMQMIVFFYFFM